jgi:Terpene cyclase DEP1
MRQRDLYLGLAVVGFVAPYYFLIQFLTAHGLDGTLFLQELFGSKISTFFAVDLLVSCVVFVRFLRQESNRYAIDHSWFYVVALLTVGLSFALPLFLYARETRFSRESAAT